MASLHAYTNPAQNATITLRVVNTASAMLQMTKLGCNLEFLCCVHCSHHTQLLFANEAAPNGTNYSYIQGYIWILLHFMLVDCCFLYFCLAADYVFKMCVAFLDVMERTFPVQI